MNKPRRPLRNIQLPDLRLFALQLGHALGIHVPATALAVRDGRETPVSRCLLCGCRL